MQPDDAVETMRGTIDTIIWAFEHIGVCITVLDRGAYANEAWLLSALDHEPRPFVVHVQAEPDGGARYFCLAPWDAPRAYDNLSALLRDIHTHAVEPRRLLSS